MTEAAPRGVVDSGVDAGDDGERPHDHEQKDDDETDHGHILNDCFDHDQSGSTALRSALLIVCGAPHRRSTTPAIA